MAIIVTRCTPRDTDSLGIATGGPRSSRGAKFTGKAKVVLTCKTEEKLLENLSDDTRTHHPNNPEPHNDDCG